MTLMIFQDHLAISVVDLSILKSDHVCHQHCTLYTPCAPQEAEGPYAWRRTAPDCTKACSKGCHVPNVTKESERLGMELGGKLVFPKGPTWSQCLPRDMLNRASLQTVVEEAAAMGCIRFRLPFLNAVAGGVLRHAIKTLEELFDKHSPMIFKVGFSHDPVWRWANTLYGYHLCRDNWSDMVVLFLSDEPFSVAMLEAALIEKYQCILLMVLACFCRTLPQESVA